MTAWLDRARAGEEPGEAAPLLRQRPRRLRRTAALRAAVAETRLRPEQLVYPLFVVPGEGPMEEIPSLPGQWRLPVERVADQAAVAWDSGVRAVLLFGSAARKDDDGASAADPEGPAQQAVRALKDALPELVVITDVCLCAYTTHGHCGLVAPDGEVMNDATLGPLSQIAVSHAEAGADLVAPSDMMDGRVAAIREALDRADYSQVGIMGYSAKYASAFYGPFREALDCAPRVGHRRSYQMDPANRREALREARLDAEEGADIIVVKPALAYLDVIAELRVVLDRPVAAYNVSGEYAMLKAAVERGWIEERPAVLEALTAIARAGADLIITYHAPEAARWLREG